jgi:tetratricopeptide (TPR) repeat protein
MLVLFTLVGAARAAAQIPENFENLQILPKDIPRDQLIGAMRAFALGLGVRCQYCHVERTPGGGADGLDLDFKSDQKPTKEKARLMLRMVGTVNDSILTKLASRSDPPVRVQCVTCHRGSALPRTLDAVLAETIAKQGVDSAIAQYRKLRDESLLLGRYNFGEQTLSGLARQLTANNPAAAIRLLELNQEFFPTSANIDFQIGEIYRARGDKAKAIERYRKALEKAPNHPQARQRLTELGGS